MVYCSGIRKVIRLASTVRKMVRQWIQKVFYPLESSEIFFIEKRLMKWVKSFKNLTIAEFRYHLNLFSQFRFWPGDDVVNCRFLGLYIASIFLVMFPSWAYLTTTGDDFLHITIGISESIMEILCLLKMINLVVNQHEIKDLVDKLEIGYQGL